MKAVVLILVFCLFPAGASIAQPKPYRFGFIKLVSRLSQLGSKAPLWLGLLTRFTANHRGIVPISGENNDCFFHALQAAGINLNRQQVTQYLRQLRDGPSRLRDIARQELLSTDEELSDAMNGLRDFIRQFPGESIEEFDPDLFNWFILRLEQGAPMPFQRDGMGGVDFLEILGRQFNFDIRIIESTDGHVIHDFRWPLSTRRRRVTLRYSSSEVGHFDLVLDKALPIPATNQDQLSFQWPNIIGWGSSDSCGSSAKYQIVRQIGYGNFARVYLVHDRGSCFAAKVIDKLGYSGDPEVLFEEAENEIASLKECNCPFLPAYIGSDMRREPLSVIIIMGYAPGENLREYWSSGKYVPSEDNAMQIWVQLLQLLEHMHSKKIMHRDVKIENMILGPDGLVRLVDFGFARTFPTENESMADQLMGTVEYVAPEMIGRHWYDGSVDIWASGVTLYVLATGHMPFNGRDPAQTFRAILNFPHVRIPNNELGLIIRQIFVERTARPTASQLLQLSYVQKYIPKTNTTEDPPQE